MDFDEAITGYARCGLAVGGEESMGFREMLLLVEAV